MKTLTTNKRKTEIENKLKEINKIILEEGKIGDTQILRYFQNLENELIEEYETT